MKTSVAGPIAIADTAGDMDDSAKSQLIPLKPIIQTKAKQAGLGLGLWQALLESFGVVT